MKRSHATWLQITVFLVIVFSAANTFPPALQAGQDSPDVLYYLAVELEDSATTQSDYYQVIETYRSVIENATGEAEQELLAVAQFAIGEIMFSKLEQYREAEAEFVKVINNYSDSSWVQEALRRIADSQERIGQNGNQDTGIVPQWLKRQQTSEESLSATNEEFTFYDPELLTPDMYEEVDPREVEAEMARLREMASIPHVPPIPIESVTTGPSLIKELLADNMPLMDYSCTMDAFLGDAPELTVELKVAGGKTRLEAGELVLLAPAGAFPQEAMYLYFPTTNQYLDVLKSGSSEGKSITRNLKNFAHFIDHLDNIETSFYLDYSAFEDEEYLVDLIPKAEKVKLSATVWISQLNKIITAMQVDNLETSQTLISIYCRNWRFNSNLSPDLFGIPDSAGSTGGIPASVSVPEALLQ